MCSSGRRPDPGGAAAAGPSEQRAAKRSADERSEAEAPKNQRAATTKTLVRLRRPKGVNVAPALGGRPKKI